MPNIDKWLLVEIIFQYAQLVYFFVSVIVLIMCMVSSQREMERKDAEKKKVKEERRKSQVWTELSKKPAIKGFSSLLAR